MNIQSLKQLFSSGKKPKGTDFATLIESFRHKDETISIEEVYNLQNKLDLATPLYTSFNLEENIINISFEYNIINVNASQSSINIEFTPLINAGETLLILNNNSSTISYVALPSLLSGYKIVNMQNITAIPIEAGKSVEIHFILINQSIRITHSKQL